MQHRSQNGLWRRFQVDVSIHQVGNINEVCQRFHEPMKSRRPKPPRVVRDCSLISSVLEGLWIELFSFLFLLSDDVWKEEVL